ncbi:N-acetylmuramoyl-L-alanine amidase [Thalassolituus oleivorans]|uniref:N-acetylmuramoyl-L-alanine amidase n=1 Tax=Thalassolituus oleivorans TaxID=187493 RepID=UPI0023F15EB4|nr:N-acetylmuramoyl-L-alanine amidase [Thalassolituus oleivorans]
MRALLIAILLGTTVISAYADVKDIRVWQSPDSTRLVFDLSEPTEYRIFDLPNPYRIVIDLNDADMNKDPDQVDIHSTAVKSIRKGKRNGKDLRIVIDVNEALEPSSQILPPNDTYPNHRLVVDLKPKETAQVVAPIKRAESLDAVQRNIIIAIDAGHGGEDPGAIGHGRTKEKEVVLSIAKELQALLNDETGFQPFMVRTGDYYIGLRERTEKARKANADFFVSIHADAFKIPQASGSSVFILSDRGESSETARWLADKENKSDLIGGLSLEGREDHLAMTLLDLSMTHKRDASARAGRSILSQMGAITKLHKAGVEEAAFVVLKAPDIPALLVETGFISNPGEAKKLADRNFQKRMAKAIFTGIKQYFETYPPTGTLLAAKRNAASQFVSYTIRPGDTLSELASRSGMDIQELRQLNGLNSDQLKIGQRIKIPSS